MEGFDLPTVASGLKQFFRNEHGFQPTTMDMPINKIHVYKCKHLDDFLPTPTKKYPNEFFRVKDEHKHGVLKCVQDDEVVLVDIVRKKSTTPEAAAFLKAGARGKLAYHPNDVVAAIVTCGGLSPGLNSVIKTIVNTLYYNYSVDRILGIKNGLHGFYQLDLMPPTKLTPEMVDSISSQGGTILGSSRGGYDVDKILNSIEKFGINQLYIVGGDGTHRAAHGISEACRARGINISVVGIPKTIDNDIGIIDRSFGFTTAVDEASRAVRAAVTEAKSYPSCIGMVKVMGRSSGFLAAHTTLATESVDICLIPEIPVDLQEVLRTLHRKLKTDGYAIMVVAEGAGANLCSTDQVDASGNKVLGKIENVLRQEIKQYFKEKNFKYNLKYIDPSYMIRSVRANAFDQTLCLYMSQNAVHGAMAGFTDFSSGIVNNKTCLIPLQIIFNCSPCTMDPNGRTAERMRIATQGALKRSSRPLTYVA